MHRKQSGKNMHQTVNSGFLQKVELFVYLPVFQFILYQDWQGWGERGREDTPTAVGNVICHELS